VSRASRRIGRAGRHDDAERHDLDRRHR
jgi:hypothetical protein